MDSQNVLSILNFLGGSQGAPAAAPATNVLQAAAPPQAAPVAPPVAPPQAAPVAPPVAPPVQAAPPPAPAPAEHPRKRLSVIDTIGRLADVFAKVGGADALYAPTLEHTQDRAIALDDHTRQVDLDKLKLALSQQEVTKGATDADASNRKRLGTALGALANSKDAAAMWPDIAAQAGITDPQQIAQVGAVLMKNPNAAGIFAKALGADVENLGKNVYFGLDGNGKQVAYQVGPDGSPHVLDFGDSGIIPSAPIKVVDTGGSQAIVGQGGEVKRILPKTARPDTILTTSTSRDNNIRDNQTKVTIAGMPARTPAGKTPAGDPAAFAKTALGNLQEISGLYKQLHQMGAIVSTSQGAGANVAARLRASGIGQTLEGAVGTKAQTARDRINSIRPQLMQSIAKATGMTGKQLDSNADVKLFMQTVTDPTKSYEANQQAIAGLVRFIQNNQAKPAASPAPARVSPRAAPRKSGGGWSIVGVK